MPEQTALSGKELARQRRAMLSRQGKQSLVKTGGQAAGGRLRPAVPSPAIPATEEVSAPALSLPETSAQTQTTLDEVCELVEKDPGALGDQANSVRALCRQRRQALATEGKRALPRKPAAAGVRGSAGYNAATANGRDLARQRRADLCRNGRGEAEPCRPTGRVRPKTNDVPAKVEIGTTLSGRVVTGTQVERKNRVTGNEAGSCRAVTGTEYVGAEQFEKFCEARPQAGPAKVGVTTTGQGQPVSGTELGRSTRVTGDETGSCRTVTGTEYLGSEQFGEFCASRGLTPRPDKVATGTTERKGLRITGSDEARANRVTGAEPGAARAITGSQYADAGVARLTINGPAKVALTHTLTGRPVSGTEVGNSFKVTGDEAGACRQISGTEYLSNEQFQSVCHTQPEPGPAKVGLDTSRHGQRITGNLVDRSEKVTGNEPGSCQRVTGSQYGKSQLCGGGAEKVGESLTVSGRTITGTGVGHGPQMTGDEQGGCMPVTGNEYIGREQYTAYCPGTPVAPAPAKVGVSQSSRGLPVSGTMLGRSGSVTGNEPGSGLAVSGTPYAGLEQTNSACGCGCGCCRAGASVASSDTGKRTMSRRFVSVDRPETASFVESAPAPEDFSIVSPARYAQQAGSRITGTGYGGAGRITGPVNLASGLVSGTPEFRYRDELPTPLTPASQSADGMPAQRITGEGRDSGTPITGDDWARSGRVTGTEGQWAQGRNLTQRGDARGRGASAWLNKERERPEVSTSRITGSAGSAGKGALITVSGGARG